LGLLHQVRRFDSVELYRPDHARLLSGRWV